MKLYIALDTGNDYEILKKQIVPERITRCIGSYKGKQSPSYQINLSGLSVEDIEFQLQCFYALAEKYNQESVLFVTDRNLCFLIFVQETPLGCTFIGKWNSVSNVDGVESWTQIHNRYYVAS